VLAAEAGAASAEPGTVVDGRLTIACGEGALRPLRVQRAGKAPVDTDAFLRGFSLPEGTCVS
jgi:methionyl-tRNA formyltransferase